MVSIVNRRNSDLTDKSDGVLYTSDGRDVEMSVASTKAFYAQVAAGLLLGYAVAADVPGARTTDHPDEQALLRALRDVPDRPGGDAGHPAGHRGRGAARSPPAVGTGPSSATA